MSSALATTQDTNVTEGQLDGRVSDDEPMTYRVRFDGEQHRRPDINIICKANDDIVAHFAFRFDEGVMIANARVDGQWLTQHSQDLPSLHAKIVLAYTLHQATLRVDDVDVMTMAYPYAIAAPSHLVVATGAGIALDVIDDTLADALEAAGFAENADLGWISAFDPQEYLDLNPDLIGVVPPREALTHFLRSGLGALRQFSLAEHLDTGFYAEAYGSGALEEPAAVFRHWLSVGRPAGQAPNEALFLCRLGLTIARLPSSFVPQRSGAQLTPGESRWQLFAHWLGQAVSTDGHAPFTDPADASLLLIELGRLKAQKGDHAAAVKAFLRGLHFDRSNLQAWQWLGDSWLTLREFALACSAYEEVARGGSADYWARSNLITALRELGDTATCLGLSQELERLYPDRLEARATRREIVKTVFEQTWSESRDAFLLSDGAVGRESFVETMSRLDEWRHVAEAELKPTVKDGAIRVVILANHYLAQCYRYRVAQKVEQLQLLGYECLVCNMEELETFTNRCQDFHVCIAFRVPWLPAIANALNYARSLGLVTIYDVDDLIFDAAYFPPPLATYGGQIGEREYAQLSVDVVLYKRAMELCDYGMASTVPLQRHVAEHVRLKTCYLHRNGYDAAHEAYSKGFRKRRSGDGTVKVFYGTGTKAHNDGFDDLVAPALAALFPAHPELRLVVTGTLTIPASLAPFADRITFVDPIWRTAVYYELLSHADISIAPLVRSEVTDCKSEIKWLEAAMLGIPSIVSDTPVFRDAIVDGVSGLIAASVPEWLAALRALVGDPALRAHMGEKAREFAHRTYSLDALSANLGTTLARLTAPLSLPRKTKIALVNVFFWPQMIGGATRVVRSNLDDFIDNHAGDCEFEVFCAVEGLVAPYQVEVLTYRGCRVTRVTHPMRAGMDWLPRDERMGEIFESWLVNAEPDLIHFHCIQRLTGTIVEAAIRHKVPYMVTIHDAWWVADNNFFLTDDGTVDDKPVDTLKQMVASRGAAIPKIERLIYLRGLLAGAEDVVAVSESFASVYADFGIGGVRAVPNGISAFTVAASAGEKDKLPIRIVHVGGMEAHKGLPLIRKALFASTFQNLELWVVDHSRHYGDKPTVAMWGSTRVVTVGKIAQDRMGEIYDRCHVLIAPSLWPESFGLVTREAMLAGLWVIASDRGAVGDDIVEGRNGFRIDVGSTKALVDVLKTIDADPARYSRRPTGQIPLRTGSEQAAELWTAYRRILPALAGEAARADPPGSARPRW